MSSRKRQLNTEKRPPVSQTDNAGFTPAAIVKSEIQTPEREPRLPLERLGDLLRRVRGERRDDLQQIADYLCIKRGFLEALEDSRYEDLPADAYAIGFLRSYANYLGLDDQDAIERYRREMAGRRKKPALIVPMPISGGRTPSALIMVGATIAAILVYVLWYAFSGPSSTSVAPPALPSAEVTSGETNTAPANANPLTTATVSQPPLGASTPPAILPVASPPLASAVVPEAATTPAPASGKLASADLKTASRITIRAEQSSWVLVSDSKGHTVFDKVLKPGESYKVPNTEGLLFTTGNGGGVAVSVDGSEFGKLAEGPSHVLRNIPLDIDHMKALATSARE